MKNFLQALKIADELLIDSLPIPYDGSRFDNEERAKYNQFIKNYREKIYKFKKLYPRAKVEDSFYCEI